MCMCMLGILTQQHFYFILTQHCLCPFMAPRSSMSLVLYFYVILFLFFFVSFFFRGRGGVRVERERAREMNYIYTIHRNWGPKIKIYSIKHLNITLLYMAKDYYKKRIKKIEQ